MPIVYIALATGILVDYHAGFLLVAFHPELLRSQALFKREALGGAIGLGQRGLAADSGEDRDATGTRPWVVPNGVADATLRNVEVKRTTVQWCSRVGD
jgi:hypothetical protein